MNSEVLAAAQRNRRRSVRRAVFAGAVAVVVLIAAARSVSLGERMEIARKTGIWNHVTCVEKSSYVVRVVRAGKIDENYSNLRQYFAMLFVNPAKSSSDDVARRHRSEEFQLESWRRLRDRSNLVGPEPVSADCQFDIDQGGWVAMLKFDSSSAAGRSTNMAVGSHARLEVSLVNAKIRFANFY